MKKPPRSELPAGWDEERIREIIEHYESQSDEEAAAEHEAALGGGRETVMGVPHALVPLVRQLIARYWQEAEAVE